MEGFIAIVLIFAVLSVVAGACVGILGALFEDNTMLVFGVEVTTYALVVSVLTSLLLYSTVPEPILKLVEVV